MSKRVQLLPGEKVITNADKIAQRLKEIKELGGVHRVATVGKIDKEARTVELSFSSEVEYERWFGIEVLGHEATEVDLSRLNNNAPLLWMHDWKDQRGVIVAGSARVDSDRVGRCTVRYSRSDEGDELFQDVLDGIVTKVSVGYSVHGMKLVEEREDIDVYRVTSWTPFEISHVSVPADDTVGVGRSATKPQEEPQQKTADHKNCNSKNHSEDYTTMKFRTYRDAQGNLCRVAVNEAGQDVGEIEIVERAGSVDGAAHRQAGADAERARVRDITELGRTYGKTDLALQFVAEGKTPEEFQRALLADFQTQRSNRPMSEQQAEANIGMTDREVRQFSIFRAVRALADPTNQRLREAAAFEFECSRAAAEMYGKTPKGIIIPNDVLNDRAFSTTAPSGGPGSNVVAQNLLAGDFISLLRKRAWVMQRARVLGGLVGNVDIPRQNAAGNVYWVGEGSAPTTSQPGVDQIHFTPKTMGAFTDITRRLLLQSTPDAEMIVRDDLLKIMSLELDRVAIYGSGTSNQPIGLNNISGINAVSLGTAGSPSFAEVVDMETKIALQNADVNDMSYAFNAAIRGKFKTTLKFPGVNGSQTIWEDGNTVNGYQTNVSNQIASGDLFFGNWNDLIVAMWGGLELTVDPYALSTSGGLRLIALQDVDVNIRHPESFTVAR